MWRACLFVCCFTIMVRGEIVDRLAVAVGHQVITEQQLDEEIRVTAFLNHQPILRTLAVRRAAADRLIQQALIQRSMEASHYPLPSSTEVNQYLQGIRQQSDDATAFHQALSEYKLTEDTLKAHLALQLTTLRFIQYRFRPEANISDAEVLQKYNAETANWKLKHTGLPPAFEQSKESIRETLLEEQTDRALTAWLEETRKRVGILYIDTSLQANPDEPQTTNLP